ncbi:MAG TPA: hypothetical protein VJK66_06870 [Gaiellaceae bacterium]|nr:hypothetical protein [Gaiellaceae bacterium]
MHLRPPTLDHGVISFVWAVVFFLYLWLGMLSIGVAGATAFILSLVAGGAIFVYVLVRGEEHPGRRVR